MAYFLRIHLFDLYSYCLHLMYLQKEYRSSSRYMFWGILRPQEHPIFNHLIRPLPYPARRIAKVAPGVHSRLADCTRAKALRQDTWLFTSRALPASSIR